MIASALSAGGLPLEGMAAQPDRGIVSIEDDSGTECGTEGSTDEESAGSGAYGGIKTFNFKIKTRGL